MGLLERASRVRHDGRGDGRKKGATLLGWGRAGYAALLFPLLYGDPSQQRAAADAYDTLATSLSGHPDIVEGAVKDVKWDALSADLSRDTVRGYQDDVADKVAPPRASADHQAALIGARARACVEGGKGVLGKVVVRLSAMSTGKKLVVGGAVALGVQMMAAPAIAGRLSETKLENPAPGAGTASA